MRPDNMHRANLIFKVYRMVKTLAQCFVDSAFFIV